MRYFLALLTLLYVASIGYATATVYVLDIRGAIDTPLVEYVKIGLTAAEKDPSAALVILEMDTPGGLGEAMESIVEAMLSSRVPTCVYVSPSGARAASAGAVIALAANFVAMAPATHIGAATPIDIGGGDLSKKIRNDAAARARTLADHRGRNKEWADKIVREAASLTESEAIRNKIADLQAKDINDLLAQLDGRKVAGKPMELANPVLTRVQMPFRIAALRVLANPNIAYLLILIAFYGLIAELSHPGAVFPGIAGGIAAILAFYALAIVTVNVAGLLLMALAVALFVGDVLLPGHGTLSLGGVVAFIVGSLMLIHGPMGTVSPWLIAVATIITLAFFLTIATLAVGTWRRPKTMGREAMIGQTAITQTYLQPDQTGRVVFEGSIWNAVSESPIAKGRRVSIVDIDGLTLIVSPK